jgi:putative exosortase-associated protein (TIGR04073 family)
MRKIFLLAGALAVTALMVSGCAGPEQKLGRGLNNINEVTRGGEFQRAVEQDSLLLGSDAGMTTGIVQGIDHTAERVGMGLYEIVTFPIPPYQPVMTKYVKPKAAYPDAKVPGNYSIPETDADQYLGFTGNEIGFWFPGSRWTMFNN